MDIKDFTKRFKILCSVVKFPKNETDIPIWHSLATSEMTDEQINRAFSTCMGMREFPSWVDFKNAGAHSDQKKLDAKSLTGMVEALFYRGDTRADSSKALLDLVGREIYDGLGGHNWWYDIKMGTTRFNRNAVQGVIEFMNSKSEAHRLALNHGQQESKRLQ